MERPLSYSWGNEDMRRSKIYEEGSSKNVEAGCCLAVIPAFFSTALISPIIAPLHLSMWVSFFVWVICANLIFYVVFLSVTALIQRDWDNQWGVDIEEGKGLTKILNVVKKIGEILMFTYMRMLFGLVCTIPFYMFWREGMTDNLSYIIVGIGFGVSFLFWGIKSNKEEVVLEKGIV